VAGYGEAIKRLRKERGLGNQLALAEKVGLNKETISRAENSENVGILHLYKIAMALGVRLTVSFGGEKKKSIPSWWSKLNDAQKKNVSDLAKSYLEQDSALDDQ
jgi:transcriptional regulator with XRE-family HTH domain